MKDLPKLQIPYTDEQLDAYVDAHVSHCESQQHHRVLDALVNLLSGLHIVSILVPPQNGIGALWLKVTEGTCTWFFSGNDESSTLFLVHEDSKKQDWKRLEVDGIFLRKICNAMVRENRSAQRASYKDTNSLLDLLSTRPKKSFARVITQSTLV